MCHHISVHTGKAPQTIAKYVKTYANHGSWRLQLIIVRVLIEPICTYGHPGSDILYALKELLNIVMDLSKGCKDEDELTIDIGRSNPFVSTLDR